MNELLRDKLSIIANDELLLQAIRAVFNEVIEKKKPRIEDLKDNRQLGEQFRAYELSKKIIEDGFNDIRARRDNKKSAKSFNKGK